MKTLAGFGLSATAAAQIVQRLQNEPQTAATWWRSLEEAPCHLYILVTEGDTRLRLCAGGSATELMPFVLKNLNERSGAAVFDVGPPIGRVMEALRGRKSAEVSGDPGLEEVRPEAPQHRATSPPTAPPPRPFIAGEYPKYKYQKGRKTIVKNAEAEAALGEA